LFIWSIDQSDNMKWFVFFIEIFVLFSYIALDLWYVGEFFCSYYLDCN